MAQDCIDAIAKGLGREPTEKEVNDIASAVQARIMAKTKLGLGEADARAAVLSDVKTAAKLAQTQAKWRQLNTALKDAALDRRGNTPDAMTTVLSGRSSSGELNAGTSIPLEHARIRDEHIGDVVNSLEKQGLLKELHANDPAFRLRVLQELRRIGDPTLEAATGDARAEAAAKTLHEGYEVDRAAQNKEGAFIGYIKGYTGRQTHDAAKLDRLGMDAWVAERIKGGDLDTDFPETLPQDMTAALQDQYRRIRDDVHDTKDDPSGSRSITFKDAASADSYNQQFGKGDGSLMGSFYSQLNDGARRTAVARQLGTNAKPTFDRWAERNIKQASLDDRQGDLATLKDRNMRDGLFRTATGIDDSPGKPSRATFWANTRAIVSMTKLGQILAGGQALVHPAFYGEMLMRNGAPNYLASRLGMIQAMFPQTAEGRMAAAASHAGIDAMIGNSLRQFGAGDEASMSGRIARASNLFYKATGFSGFMSNLQAGAAVHMTHYMALAAGKTLDQLPEVWQTSMRRYGIDEAAWDLARQSPQMMADGRMHLIPADIADVATREKFSNYLHGELAGAANEPTAWARNQANFGTRAGTVGGELARSAMMYKGFALSLMQQQFGPLMRNGWKGAVPGVMRLSAEMTALGVLGIYMKGLWSNQVPVTPTTAAGWAGLVAQGAINGGATGLFGDAFLRDANKSGGEQIASLAGGPVGGIAGDLLHALNVPGFLGAAEHQGAGHPALSRFAGLAGDMIPNYFATHAAWSWLADRSIAEFLHPGAIARHNALLKKEGERHIMTPVFQ